MIRPALDHLVFAAADLASGQAALEQLLGVPLQPGGQHQYFGTHNAVLNLGPLYLEVIAVDPAAPALPRPRWFELDTPQMRQRIASGPQLIHWVCRVPHLETALLNSPEDHGAEVALSRGQNRWLLSVPPDGSLPMGGVLPSLIEWQSLSPAQRLVDHGVRLKTLHLTTPDPARLEAALAALNISDVELDIETGPPRLEATLTTPNGEVRL
ncbi:VOC family protein [Deinococcus ruber]|uniref:Glyoxalase n=1 Tax=Deinococcus ruber TaxID=1848197 RepID=A0A918C3X7_9DEIO|nr:VOC family protein [Deinococcus ruber]GGR05373.1 glyoxalase [Deinococcus ruber]